MSRTLRRRKWYAYGMEELAPKERARKTARDNTCRPGCVVCGHYKPFHRLAKRQERQQWHRLVDEQLLAEYDVPTPKNHMKRPSSWF